MAFITLEGSEGVGKTTALTHIKTFLHQQGIDFIVTREPGGTPMAEKIRAVLLDHYEEKIAPETEALLFFAGRKQNIEAVIKPALQAGQWVICDRFTDASYAYQGGGRGVEQTFLDALADAIQGSLQPDLTLLLDAPIEIGLARMQSRVSGVDRIEKEGIAFFQRVRQAYLARAAAFKNRFVVIDASQTIETVQLQIQTALLKLLR